MGQREKRRVGGKEEHEGDGEKLVRHTDPLFCSVVPSFSPHSVSYLSFSLSPPDLCGHCWGVTGACSNTIPVTRGEEWPPFPLHSLSFPPGRQACLFVFPDIRRHLNSPVKRSTMHQDETNGWRMRPHWHLSLPQFEDVCRAEVWLWVCRHQCQKPLSCNAVRGREIGERHRGHMQIPLCLLWGFDCSAHGWL